MSHGRHVWHEAAKKGYTYICHLNQIFHSLLLGDFPTTGTDYFVITSLNVDKQHLVVISTVSTCVCRLLAGKDWILNQVRLCCFILMDTVPNEFRWWNCDVTANNRRARCSTFQTAALAAHWVRQHALRCQAAWQTGYLCFGVQPVWCTNK